LIFDGTMCRIVVIAARRVERVIMLGGWETQLRRGMVDLAVLAALGEREDYGDGIVERLGKFEGLAFTESTVYPVLTRLEREGWLRGPAGGFAARADEAVVPAHGKGAAAADRDEGFVSGVVRVSGTIVPRRRIMMATATVAERSSLVQALIDARLDTIDKMLLGRVSRSGAAGDRPRG
jgi:hypothetical protein